MTDLLWIGPVVVTLWLAFLSFVARTWWVAAYLGALFVGFIAGAMTWIWPDGLRSAWWWAWCVYVFVLPIARTLGRKRSRGGLYDAT